MKNHAFTIAEVVIAMTIVGILAVLLLTTINNKSLDDKTSIAQAYKVLDSFEQASAKIRDMEPDKCPTGAFIAEVTGSYEFALINSDGTTMNTAQVYELYSKYLKFSNTSPIDFCANTGYCTLVNEAAEDDEDKIDTNNIKGAKLPTGAYIGFEVTGIADCPDYYLPEYEDIKTGEGKCWGKLYVDTNGTKEPNELGKDVFIFGLGEGGIVR